MLSAKALLDANPAPTEPEIRHAIAGNLCRCTGYGKIVEAIAAAAASMRGTMSDGLAAPTPALQVIGKRLPRVDAKERVTGQAIYPADLALPGMVAREDCCAAPTRTRASTDRHHRARRR